MGWWSPFWWAWKIRWALHRKGCCTSCDGTGSSHDVETGGRCWDCYGTGHCHVTNRWHL